MKFIDLSVPIDENTPVYPGDPKVLIEPIADFENYGMNDHKISLGIHVGTHIDAPWHMVRSGKKMDQIPIEQFSGAGKLVEGLDFTKVKQAGIGKGDIVLFKTGMSELFGKDEYYKNYPEISEELANYLVNQKVKIVGMDMASPDHPPFKIHKILLGANILIIENLTNLDKLIDKEFTIYALPIKLALDGAPARVIAEVK